MTLDIKFKWRLPQEGVKWANTRVFTHMMGGGRLDTNLMLLDEVGTILYTTRHAILSTGVEKKFGRAKPSL